MKIAFIVGQFPSLSETFILNQITGLIDRGHEVDIYAAKPGDISKIHPDVEKYNLLQHTYYEHKAEQKTLAYINAFKFFLISFFVNTFQRLPVLIKVIKSAKPGQFSQSLNLFYSAASCLQINQTYDIVHCHFGMIGITGMMLKEIGAIKTKKLITSFYGLDVTMYPKIKGEEVYKPLFQTGDLFLGLTQLMVEQLIQLGCSPKKLLKLPTTSVNISRYNFQARVLHPEEPIKLLTVARLVEKKGLEYSIQAVSKVIKNNPNFNIIYTIVGTGYLHKSLENLIKNLGLVNQIKLVGAMTQAEVRNLYSDSHIFILSSITAANGDQEGLPTVLQEAQAMGLPILSTFHSGIPETILNGESGFLVPEKNVDALADKLEYLVKNPQVWQLMGQEEREFIEKNYDLDKVNDKLVKIYQQMLNEI